MNCYKCGRVYYSFKEPLEDIPDNYIQITEAEFEYISSLVEDEIEKMMLGELEEGSGYTVIKNE